MVVCDVKDFPAQTSTYRYPQPPFYSFVTSDSDMRLKLPSTRIIQLFSLNVLCHSRRSKQQKEINIDDIHKQLQLIDLNILAVSELIHCGFDPYENWEKKITVLELQKEELEADIEQYEINKHNKGKKGIVAGAAGPGSPSPKKRRSSRRCAPRSPLSPVSNNNNTYTDTSNDFATNYTTTVANNEAAADTVLYPTDPQQPRKLKVYDAKQSAVSAAAAAASGGSTFRSDSLFDYHKEGIPLPSRAFDWSGYDSVRQQTAAMPTAIACAQELQKHGIEYLTSDYKGPNRHGAKILCIGSFGTDDEELETKGALWCFGNGMYHNYTLNNLGHAKARVMSMAHKMPYDIAAATVIGSTAWIDTHPGCHPYNVTSMDKDSDEYKTYIDAVNAVEELSALNICALTHFYDEIEVVEIYGHYAWNFYQKYPWIVDKAMVHQEGPLAHPSASRFGVLDSQSTANCKTWTSASSHLLEVENPYMNRRKRGLLGDKIEVNIPQHVVDLSARVTRDPGWTEERRADLSTRNRKMWGNKTDEELVEVKDNMSAAWTKKREEKHGYTPADTNNPEHVSILVKCNTETCKMRKEPPHPTHQMVKSSDEVLPTSGRVWHVSIEDDPEISFCTHTSNPETNSGRAKEKIAEFLEEYIKNIRDKELPTITLRGCSDTTVGKVLAKGGGTMKNDKIIIKCESMSKWLAVILRCPTCTCAYNPVDPLDEKRSIHHDTLAKKESRNKKSKN